MNTKEKRMPWTELVDRTRPVVTYVFNDGKRVFHAPKRGKR